MKISTSIKINASPSTVWQIFTAFDKYPDWNPFIKSITGTVQVGNKIKVVLPGATFKPKVLKIEKNTELKWLGSLLFKGIFDGAHRIHISDNGDGTVNFEQSETFSGILVTLFKKSLNQNTKPGFEIMNLKLKELAEKRFFG